MWSWRFHLTRHWWMPRPQILFNFMRFLGNFGKIVCCPTPAGLAPRPRGNPGYATVRLCFCYVSSSRIKDVTSRCVKCRIKHRRDEISWKVDLVISGSKEGARDARLPLGSKFFHFHAVFGQKIEKIALSGVGAAIRHCLSYFLIRSLFQTSKLICICKKPSRNGLSTCLSIVLKGQYVKIYVFF